MMKGSLRYSEFLVRYSAVQRGGSSDKVNFDCFSPGFWILDSDFLLYAPCPMLYALCERKI
jgi:hypothetical protein